MGHSLLFFPSQWQPAERVLRRLGEWWTLLYAVTVSVLANWVMPDTSATTALFTIAIGLPMMIFRPRRPPLYIGRTIGVLMVLVGVAWLYVLALRVS